MLHMPSPMLLGGASEDLYPLFLAKITTLATDGVVDWSGVPSAFQSGYYRVSPAAGVGFMYGSTWNSFGIQNLTYARAIQHALPSAAVFNSLATLGHQVFFRLGGGFFTYDGNGPNGVNRNGYQSLTFSGEYDSNYAVFQILDLIRFDAATGKAWRSSPNIGSSETEYNYRT
jgi:hypothetical protein